MFDLVIMALLNSAPNDGLFSTKFLSDLLIILIKTTLVFDYFSPGNKCNMGHARIVWRANLINSN
jgi:hypothetical protein